LLSSNAKKSSLRLPVQPIKATTDYIQNTIWSSKTIVGILFLDGVVHITYRS
jgi:hypothetical protein